MRLLVFLSIFLLPQLIFAQEQTETKTERIEVVVGIDKDISFDFAFNTNIQIADGSIAQIARVIPNQRKIVIRGLKRGKTSFDVYDKVGDLKARYIIDVSESEKSKIVSDIKELIGDVEGIEIGIKGDKVYVGGKIYVPNDIGRVATVLDIYPDVLRFVEMAPQAQLVIAKKMQEELVRNNYRDLNVRVVNGKYWVEGTVASLEKDYPIVQRVVTAYLPDKLESLARQQGSVATPGSEASNAAVLYFLNENPRKQKPQPPPKQVKITAQFVELSKDYSKVFAFKWAPLLGDNGGQIQIGETDDGDVTSSSSGIFSAIISNLFPRLISAKNAGYARVIQSGMIITEVEKQGSISKQSQQSFAVGQAEQGVSNAQSISVGFNMTVTPRIFPNEKVEMSIGVNVSVPGETDANGNPTSISNSVNTAVIVKSKSSAVIGGIVQKSTSTAYDRDPFVANEAQNGNALFVLLRAKQYNTNNNQYVVFITPEIVESASAGTEEIRKKFRKRQRR